MTGQRSCHNPNYLSKPRTKHLGSCPSPSHHHFTVQNTHSIISSTTWYCCPLLPRHFFLLLLFNDVVFVFEINQTLVNISAYCSTGTSENLETKASVTLKRVNGIRCHLKQVSCVPLELFPSFFLSANGCHKTYFKWHLTTDPHVSM